MKKVGASIKADPIKRRTATFGSSSIPYLDAPLVYGEDSCWTESQPVREAGTKCTVRSRYRKNNVVKRASETTKIA